MDLRRTETRLAYFTLAVLIPYVPIETWTSWPHSLLHPMYLVDVVAMVLLFVAARRSLRIRPRTAPALLAAAWGWAAANGWRATSWRALEVTSGGTLELGRIELWVTGFATVIALACFALSLFLVVRIESREIPGE